MNGARSTFKRKGYLLTALAAAVLLAASPGTASAQTPSVDFTSHTVTVMEGASSSSKTNPAVKVNVSVSGLPAGKTGTDDMGADTPRQAAINRLGMLTYRLENPSEGSSQITVSPMSSTPASLSDLLAESNVIELTLEASADPNWKDENFTLRVTSSANINTGSTLNGTIDDSNFVPVAAFSRTSIKITENSSTSLSVEIKTDSGATDAISTMIPDSAGAVVLTVSPANSIFAGSTGCPTDPKTTPTAPVFVSTASGSTATYDKTKGELTINQAEVLTTAQTLTLQACDDMVGYKDPMITMSFKADSLKTDDGNITAGSDVTIHVESDETKPTVEFGTTDINIDEGGTQSVYIVADTTLGSEVDMATVMVSGDARVSLTGSNVTAGDDVDAYGNGSYTVAFGESANTKVTLSANGDDTLGDGETKTAMATITSADGATIGSDKTLTVTVRGSTSVPALPLIGQLLLALFLMAGGSRLYRRRNG